MIDNHNSTPRRPSSSSSKPTKRKRFDNEEHHRKRRRRHREPVSNNETETLTRKAHSSPNLVVSNRFQSFQSSSFQLQINRCRNWSTLSGDCNRKWTFTSNDFSSYKDKIVVVSYNILGVENASKHPDLYYKVPPKYKEWDWRKKLICEEMNRYNAGIMCFQEVDQFNDLNISLQKDGFRGVYKLRTGEAYDGCAIFWKDELFSLLHEENIEFQSFGLRNNVAQFCILKMKINESESELCMKQLKKIPVNRKNLTEVRSLVVANTHVLFNPKRGDIKLGQIRLFLDKVYKLSQEWGNIPVVIGGDFNSIPRSALYQFLASSELDVLVHDRRNISGQLEHQSSQKHLRSLSGNVASTRSSVIRRLMYSWSDEELINATGDGGATHIQHQLKLSSAYVGVPGSTRSRDTYGEPLATSYHSKFMGTVDYIWHTKELVPVKVLETLPIDILRRTGGLPSERWGSDHLALVCELAFADDDLGRGSDS